MKEDEKYFMSLILKECSRDENNEIREEYKFVRDIIRDKDFTIHRKRALYILEKWSGRGWYDYGVTLDLGWLTPEGIKIAKELNI